MKLSFKQILDSQAYQIQAANSSKAAIFISLFVAVIFGLSSEQTIGIWNWLWVIPVLIFGISIFVAMPLFMIQVYLASLASGHLTEDVPPKAENFLGSFLILIKNTWDLFSLFISGFVTYIFLTMVAN